MTLARRNRRPARPTADPRKSRPPIPAVEPLDRRVMLSAAAAPTVPVSEVPLLHSRPAAAVKVYLDFDGDTTPSWGSYQPGVTPAYSRDFEPTTFDDAELADLRQIWARVADLFSPFDVDVTTQDPGNLDDFKTVRVVIGGNGAWYENGFAGGTAYVGGFTGFDPNTCWVFPLNLAGGDPKIVAIAAAHEAGHVFGLAHQSAYDGGTKVYEYNPGTAVTAPTMGMAYYSARALWWAGPSMYGPFAFQDDLEVLSLAPNNFGFRADDRANAPAGAATLALGSTATGVVERTNDVDYFKFTTAGGVVTIAGNVPQYAGMLDPVIELRDGAGNLIATGDGAFLPDGPYQGDLITRALAAGTYYVAVRGHGLVSTAAQGANLGSFHDVGQYTVTATVAATPPRQAYPNPSTPFTIQPTGTSVLQAENFDTGGQGTAYHETDAANLGGKYRPGEGVDLETTTDTGGGFNVGFARPGEWIEYTVDVTQADSYQIALRLAAQQAGAALHLELDGRDITGSLAVPNTGGWQRWQTVTKTDVLLLPGRHVLRVAFDKAGSTGFVANLNSIAFSRYVFVPPPQTPFTGTPFGVGQTIEAEQFDAGGEGVAYHDADAANLGGKFRTGDGVDLETTTDTGGGFGVGFAKVGEWLEYTVNIPTGGRYDLSFRVANAAAGGSFHVEFDTLNATGPIAVPNTGGFQKWQTITRTIQAVGGPQVMRIAFETAAANGFVGNLNWIRLTPAAPAARIVVQAEDYLPGGDGIGHHDTDVANLGGKYRPAEPVDIETTTDAGGGFNVGYVRAGEWLKYGFNVTTAGTYSVDFRVASTLAGGSFHFEVDGIPEPGIFFVPATGGYQSWQTITAPSVTLSAGPHTLRIVMDESAPSGFVGNFNWFALTQLS